MPEEYLSPEILAQRRRQQRLTSQAATEQSKDAHGSSNWLTPDEIGDQQLHKGHLLFGRNEQGLLWYEGNGHCLTFGPTGSGKSVSVVVPNLLTYPGSVVCIDPKGAIASVTARQRRAMGQKVILLDPFDEVAKAQRQNQVAGPWPSLPCDKYNPLGHLDPLSKNLIDDVREIAASLVVSESENHRYFSDSARTVLECFILYTIWKKPPKLRTLEILIDLVFSKPEEIESYLVQIERDETDIFSGYLRQLANQIKGFSKEGGPAIWSTLRRSLNFLQSENLTTVTQPSDIDFSRIKDEPTTIYLVLPARRLNTHGAWLRLMLSVILNQVSDSRQPQYPVLFLLDECAALQRLEILETAVGLMRGYGMKLWLIFQDLPQLQRLYGESWSTFMSNSGVRQFFNVNDTVTADFVSQYMGNQTRQVFSETLQPNQMAGSGSVSVMQRPLLTPDEVRRLGKDEQILLYEGLKPIQAKKLSYYKDEDPEFRKDGKKLFDADPYIITPQK